MDPNSFSSFIDPNKLIEDSLKENTPPTIKVKNVNPPQQMFYSRRERRNLAKQFGLHKIKETAKEKAERQHRAMEAGQQIHMQHVMEAENAMRNQMAEKEAKRIQNLVESFGEERTKKILEEEAKIAAKKQAKKNRKRNK